MRDACWPRDLLLFMAARFLSRALDGRLRAQVQHVRASQADKPGVRKAGMQPARRRPHDINTASWPAPAAPAAPAGVAHRAPSAARHPAARPPPAGAQGLSGLLAVQGLQHPGAHGSHAEHALHGMDCWAALRPATPGPARCDGGAEQAEQAERQQRQARDGSDRFRIQSTLCVQQASAACTTAGPLQVLQRIREILEGHNQHSALTPCDFTSDRCCVADAPPDARPPAAAEAEQRAAWRGGDTCGIGAGGGGGTSRRRGRPFRILVTGHSLGEVRKCSVGAG